MIVPPVAMGAVLAGAALHATWNVGIRGGSDRRATTALLAISAAVLGALALPFLPAPARAAWPHLAVTALLHILYFNLVAAAYSLGAISLTYSVMRGAAPALAALIASVALGEHLGAGGWAGLGLIVVGIWLLARRRGEPGERKALAFAMLNALVIALYTVNDGIGTRLSHAPITYAVWTFALPGLPAALILLRGRLGRMFAGVQVSSALRRGVGGGLCSMVSYTLALWAMTLAPIGAVAALREMSVLFGILFAWVFLRERPGARSILAAVIILSGAVILDAG